jgi:hypothetical protein
MHGSVPPPALTVTSTSVDFRILMHPTFDNHAAQHTLSRACAFARGNGNVDSVRARPVGYLILDRNERKIA